MTAVTGLATQSAAAGETRPRNAKPAAIELPTGQPLRFFTIAERLAQLRARGALPAAQPQQPPVATLAALATDSVPSARELGLRVDPPETPVPPADAILGTIPFAIPDGELAAKWRAVMARWAAEEARIAACEANACSDHGARKWLEIRASAGARSGLDRLAYVHAALNRSISYGTDYQIFGAADYWATPLEVVERAGDCEDYAIAKYLMLRSVGIDGADMTMVALHEPFSGQYHAVLAVRQAAGWVFLDNKRPGLAHEHDYADVRPVATVDDSGQAMLVMIAGQRLALRLKTL